MKMNSKTDQYSKSVQILVREDSPERNHQSLVIMDM